MKKTRKLTRWVLGGIGSLLILVLLSLLLLPGLIDLEPLKEEILADISKDVGGRIQAQQIEISLLIRPHAVLRQVTLSVPGKVTASAEALTVYPKILSLLTGKVEPGKIKAESPQIDLTVRKSEAKGKAVAQSPYTGYARERLVEILDSIRSSLRGIVVTVTNGKLNVSQGKAIPFRFQHMKARLKFSSQKSKVSLSCTSNLWKNLYLEARFGLPDNAARGQLDAVRFQPEPLVSFFLPGYSNLVGDESILDLGVNFESYGSTDAHAQITGSIPRLILHGANDNLEVSGEKVAAALHMDQSGTTVSLNTLILANPELRATGRFRWDRDKQHMALEIEGRGVDVDSTRKAALAVAGDFETTKNIFEVVQGGTVPFITFNAQGKSLAELGETKNFRIEGRITGGKIFIPGPDIALAEVSGDAIISKGILQGRNAAARLGNSVGRKGELKLGLKDEDAPFHLEVLVLADLAELPPLLKRMVESESFMEEMSLVENLEGRAQGRLLLGESTDAIEARVDVSEFNLTAHYRRLPFPVQISGGSFTYDETEISLEKTRVELVQSYFTLVSGWFRWNETPEFDVKARDSKVSFEEIYSCLVSSGIAEYIEKAQEIKGTVAFSALNLRGPLLKPQSWQVDIAGKLDHVTINRNPLGLTLGLTGGNFRSAEGKTQQELSLHDVVVTILDSSLKVSGVINDYLNEPNRVDMSFQGEMGPQTNQRLSDFIDLPEDLHLRSPVFISEARLVWEKQAKTSFTGNIDVPKGPRLLLDILQRPEELLIKQIRIEDEESSASLGLTLKNKEVSIDFRGHLDGTTFGKLVQKDRLLKGRIEGDFQAAFFINDSARSTATGSLSAKELEFRFAAEEPLKVERFSVEGIENGIQVHSAVCSWDSSRMHLRGKVNFSKEGYVLDSALMLNRFDWDRLRRLSQQASGKDGAPKSENFWDLPVAADLDVTAEDFSLAGLTWNSVKAHVYLSRHKIHAVIKRADVCGIDTPGVVEVTPQNFVLAFEPAASNQDLAPTVNCLVNRKGIASGTFSLGGVVTAEKKGDLIGSLDGNIEFVSREGRLRRASPSGALQQTFDLLHDAEAFEGEVPDLEQEGFAYKAITVRGTLRNGHLIFEEATINGAEMKMVFLGKVNLVDRKLDLELLVSPFSTVDKVIGKVPLVSSILGGHLVTIPIKVKGDMKSPGVTPLHPSSVAKGLLRLLKRTVTLPVTVVQPLLPEPNQGKRQEQENEKDEQGSQDNGNR